MDTIIHIENDNYVGRTEFSGRLVKDALALAIKDVRGVARLGEKMRLHRNKGVQIFEEEDALIINISLCVEYGYTVADVSYRVQEAAISIVSQLTDKKVAHVNIKVIGTKVTKKGEEEESDNGADDK